MSDETFMVTGSTGCIGSWVIRNLVAEGTPVVATDIVLDPVRQRLVMSDSELEQVTFVHMDVLDLAAVKDVVEQPLPFPADLDDSGLRGILGTVPHTPLAQACEQTITTFRQLLKEDRVDLAQLEN